MKTRIKHLFVKSLLLSTLGLVVLLSSSCHSKNAEQKYKNPHAGIRYFLDNKGIQIWNLTIEEIPDSVFRNTYACVNLESSYIKDYAKLLSKFKPDSVTEIIIRDADSFVNFSVDLKRFKNLDDLNIEGNKLKKIVFHGNLDCHLNRLSIFSDHTLDMPDFDSAFLNLKDFSYSGSACVVPKWIEKMKSLQRLWFDSKHIEKIDFDPCKMKHLALFDIATSDLYHSELQGKEILGRYNVLQKYMDCKPNLQFKYVPPPL